MKNLILKVLVLGLLGSFFAGCTNGVEAPPLVENRIEGTVAFGAPLRLASVSLYEWKDGRKGAKLGSSETSEEGYYELKFRGAKTGSFVLETAGGTLRDPATGIELKAQSGDVLKAAVSLNADDREQVVHLNAWTTLTESALWELIDTESENFEDTLSKVRRYFNKHFFLGQRLQVHDVEGIDLEDYTNVASDEKTLLALTHAGLSQMALDISLHGNKEPGSVSPFDILKKLVEDFEDGWFDGKHRGEPIYLDEAKTKRMDSYTTRSNLAVAIHRYLKGRELDEKMSINISSKSLTGRGGFYDLISRDKNKRLYPKSQRPKPFDRVKPTLSIVFKEYNETIADGMMGDGQVTATADDNSAVESIKLLEPKVELIALSASQSVVEIHSGMKLNAQEAYRACNLVPPAEGIENQFCVCMQAEDISKNWLNKVQCVERPLPDFKIVAPVAEQAFNRFQLEDRNIRVHAEIESSLDLVDCKWTVEPINKAGWPNGQEFPGGLGEIKGKYCSIDAEAVSSVLPDGSYELVLKTVDISGREGKYSSSNPFILVRETPQMTVVSPIRGAYLNSKTLVLKAKADDLSKIIKVDLRVLRSSLSRTDAMQAYTLQINSKMGVSDGLEKHEATFELSGLEDGFYIAQMEVTDIYGNKSLVMDAFNFGVKTSAPLLLGEVDGVLQPTFVQENHKLSAPSNRKFRRNRVGAKNPWAPRNIRDWETGEPREIRDVKIHRWVTRVNDLDTAPIYRVRFENLGGSGRVKWSLSDTCLSHQEADQAAIVGASSELQFPLVQRYSKWDLKRPGTLCLSIHAEDLAGNVGSHYVENIEWSPKVPGFEPIKSSRFERLKEEDFGTDLDFMRFLNGKPREASSNPMLFDYEIFSNPYAEDVAFRIGYHGSNQVNAVVERELVQLYSSKQDGIQWMSALVEDGGSLADGIFYAQPNGHGLDNVHRYRYSFSRTCDSGAARMGPAQLFGVESTERTTLKRKRKSLGGICIGCTGTDIIYSHLQIDDCLSRTQSIIPKESSRGDGLKTRVLKTKREAISLGERNDRVHYFLFDAGHREVLKELKVSKSGFVVVPSGHTVIAKVYANLKLPEEARVIEGGQAPKGICQLGYKMLGDSEYGWQRNYMTNYECNLHISVPHYENGAVRGDKGFYVDFSYWGVSGLKLKSNSAKYYELGTVRPSDNADTRDWNPEALTIFPLKRSKVTSRFEWKY